LFCHGGAVFLGHPVWRTKQTGCFDSVTVRV
jgi:hypothetical protein